MFDGIDWPLASRESLVSGTLAGLLSAAVLLAASKRDSGSTFAAMNAESHWLWGDEALHEDRPTLRHTVTGFITHQLATVFWASVLTLARGRRARPPTTGEALLAGLTTGAAAAAIDYTLVPKRLSPGFEHRLKTGSMACAFAAIGAGLAIGTLLSRGQRR